MKVAVITANIGGIDEIRGLPRQTIEIDYYYYNEFNLPVPLPNLENRLKSKYLKIQTHRFLPNYDAYIWLDGSVEINGANFAESFIDEVKHKSIAIYRHRERKSAYEEIEYIIEQMLNGSTYLLSRYGNQQIFKELLFFKEKQLPEDYPLFNCFTFVRLNNDIVNKAFDEWWLRCIEFSNFDQAMFSYCMWKENIDVNVLEFDELRTHKLFERKSHKIINNG